MFNTGDTPAAAEAAGRTGEYEMDAVVKSFPRVDAKPEQKLEPVERPTREAAEAAAKTLIAWLGDNPNREGLSIRRAVW